MPKVRCRCDAVIPLGGIPCEHEYKFMSDHDFENWQGTIEADEIYRAMSIFVHCPECKGLLMYWNGFSNPPTYYSPADRETGQGVKK